MRSFILLYFICFFSSSLWGQCNILGQLKGTDTNQGLYGASVFLADLKLGTLSDGSGNFQFPPLKKGNYVIEISAIGYESQILTLNLVRDTVLQITLSPAVKEMTELIVTGVGRSSSGKINPVSIKAIDASSLDVNGSQNIMDGLQKIPGVDQITTGSAISKPVIRGLGYNRIITLNNGLRQEGQQWGDEHGIEMDEYSVGRVEIIKGPGSLMYGSDGIAGVLNFLSPKPPVLGAVKTHYTSNYQTNNQLFANSFHHAENKKRLLWQARITQKRASNFQNCQDGKVLNSGFKELDGIVMVGTNNSWGHSYLTLSGFSQTINLPEGERDSLGNFIFTSSSGQEQTAVASDYKGFRVGTPHQMVQHFNIQSKNYWILKRGALSADWGYSINNRKEYGDPVHPDDVELFFSLRTLQYQIRYNFVKVKGWEITLGSGGMWQQNRNKGSSFLIPEYGMMDAGIYALTNKTMGKLTIAGGLRFDYRNIHTQALFLDSLGTPVSEMDENAKMKFSSLTDQFNGISGSIGLAYQLSSFETLKLNVSRGYRAPNVAELTSNGRHEGTFRYELGNAELLPEISHQLDVSYLMNTEHVTIELSPFINVIDHFIFSEKLPKNAVRDSLLNIGDDVSLFRFASGQASLFGGEIYTDVHPHPLDWLHIENSFSFVQGLLRNQPDSSRYLPFVPAPKFRSEWRAQWKECGILFSNVYFKVSVDHFFEKRCIFSAFGTETKTPAYSLLGAGIGGEIKGFKRKDFLSVFISGENLTNVAYQNHLSRLKYAPMNFATGQMGIYNMGRNISIKMIMTF
jgi:iron complex outermembrane receptor protein